MTVDAGLSTRLEGVRTLIRTASPHPERVRLVGVTKGFPAAAAAALVGAGVADLGENYAQELVAKAPAAPGATWHFLGPVQRNKVRRLAPVVGWWHGVDRLAVGASIASHAPGARVLAQVNLSGERHRPGVEWAEVAGLIGGLRQLDLDVQGLMGVASQGDARRARSQFDRLVATAADLGLPERSIGMSDDLEAALAAGSTMVRVGRALLGPRPRSVRATE